MATLGPLILLTLFILAFCREPEKHTLCISPYLTMEYVYCGFDVKNFYVILDIWYESMKILERTLDACTGHDDEMEFCGNLKGETIWINFHKALPIRLLNKGTYTFAMKGFVDGKKNDDVCLNFILTLKGDI
ncbi:lymphocyte antigen 96 isoform X3 [Lissotriton helveticus]